MEASCAGVLPTDREPPGGRGRGQWHGQAKGSDTPAKQAGHARPALWLGDPYLPQATLQTAEPAPLATLLPPGAAELSLLRGGPGLGSTSSSNSR